MRRLQVDFAQPQLLDAPLPPKVPGKLRHFDAIPIAQLLNEIEHYAKRRLQARRKSRLGRVFFAQTRDLQEVKRKIEDAMRDLNDRINQLFGLTDNEIGHIEGAVPE